MEYDWTVYEKDGRAPTLTFKTEEAAEGYASSFPDGMTPVTCSALRRDEAPEYYDLVRLEADFERNGFATEDFVVTGVRMKAKRRWILQVSDEPEKRQTEAGVVDVHADRKLFWVESPSNEHATLVFFTTVDEILGGQKSLRDLAA